MRANPVPAYAVISEDLRRDIAAGKYAGGRRLPTESALAERYQVSRQTVRRAFQDLVSESAVSRTPGRGTFANDDSSGQYVRAFGSIDDLLNLSSDTTMEVLSPLDRRSDIYASSRLQLATDLVYAVTFRRLHDGVPFVETTVYLPDDVAGLVMSSPELEVGAIGTNTIIGLLEPLLRSPIARADQSITVSTATAAVAKSTNCETGHPMLRIDRLYFDLEGRPTELAVNYFLPERYTNRVTLRRSGLPRLRREIEDGPS